MKKYLIFIFLATVTFSIISCEKTVTVKALPYENQLSIECLLQVGKVPRLYLNKSVAYFDPTISPEDLFIRNASVRIYSSGSSDSLHPSSEHNDFLCREEYFWLGDVSIKANTQYFLEVTFQGQTFTSETTTSQEKPSLDSVGYTPKFNDLYGEHEGVIFYYKDIPGQSNNYRYKMVRQVDSTIRTANNKTYRTECNGANLFTVTEIGRSVYNDDNKDGLAQNFIIEPSYTHTQGSKATVYLQTMDDKSAKFFDALDRQKLSSYNPFVEPVFLESQIDGCIGVFGSINVSDPMPFIYPE